MASALIGRWWDKILDGGIYRVDVDSSGYNNLGTLRAALYREAEARGRLVATHKAAVDALIIQAWGITGLPLHQPRLRGITNATAAPKLYTRLGSQPQGSWQPAPWLQAAATAPQEPPPTPIDQAAEPDDEALLGPCTCGLAPACTPDCARVAGYDAA